MLPDVSAAEIERGCKDLCEYEREVVIEQQKAKQGFSQVTTDNVYDAVIRFRLNKHGYQQRSAVRGRSPPRRRSYHLYKSVIYSFY